MAASFGHVASHSRRPRSGRAAAAGAGVDDASALSSSTGRRVVVDQRRAWASTSSRSVVGHLGGERADLRRVDAPGPRDRARRRSPCTRPGRGDMTTIRSPRRAASRTLWVTNSTVVRAVADEGVELLVQGVAGHRVEGAERLVHQQDVGVLGQRPGQRAALAHAARQLVRPLRGEAAEVHRLDAARVARAPALVLGTPASRIGSSTLACTVSHGNSADSWNISAVVAVDVDGAGRRLVEAGDEVEDRRLAAARGADEADELAGRRRRGRRRPARSRRAAPEPNVLSTPRSETTLMRSQPRRRRLAALGEDLVEQGEVVDAGRRQVDGIEQAGGDGVVGRRLQRRGDRVERELEVLPGAGDRGVGEAARRELLDAVVDGRLGRGRVAVGLRRWRRRGPR